MSMERGICEWLSLIFPKEAAVAKANVVDLISRAFPVQFGPLLCRCLALPVSKHLLTTY